ncbi:MAG: hypothetical protein ABI772_12490 [Bacteroidota bacterium]
MRSFYIFLFSIMFYCTSCKKLDNELPKTVDSPGLTFMNSQVVKIDSVKYTFTPAIQYVISVYFNIDRSKIPINQPLKGTYLMFGNSHQGNYAGTSGIYTITYNSSSTFSFRMYAELNNTLRSALSDPYIIP